MKPISMESLAKLRASPYLYPTTKVWAYEHSILGDPSQGHTLCLMVGPENTHDKPPLHAPDGAHGPGWKYLPVGTVNLSTGDITPGKP